MIILSIYSYKKKCMFKLFAIVQEIIFKKGFRFMLKKTYYILSARLRFCKIYLQMKNFMNHLNS